MSASLQELGYYVAAAREEMGLLQDELVENLGPPVNRTALALLEQGRRLPPSLVLTKICSYLKVPRAFWESFLEEKHVQRVMFESALGEMVGGSISVRALDSHSQGVAHKAVLSLFNSDMVSEQLYTSFCAALVHYNVPEPSYAFFRHYLGTDAFKSVDAFFARVEMYQADAIRLYSSFATAYSHLSSVADLDSALKSLAVRSDDVFRRRADWSDIEIIADERLPDLGYISAARVQKAKAERTWLAQALEELANKIEKEGRTAVDALSTKKRRKMGSLLRSFDSTIPHDLLSPLFAPDPDRLRREAARIAPKGQDDIRRMEETQATGLRNLARYLTADHMDVYVATSMRSDADFLSVNSFVKRLFAQPDVRPLRLRYFNPTQSWIEDRAAKGLVEALMLKRADIAVYLAQKTDSFGKDSEASVSLGQGKPVIVYVPSLQVPACNVDSAELAASGRKHLQQVVEREADPEDREVDDSVDDYALLAQALFIRLSRADDRTLTNAVAEHWADFDLYSEDGRISQETERAEFRKWLDSVVKGTAPANIPAAVRAHVIGVLVAVATNLEKRAITFREIHPLALQVILSSGVLNGILVVRTVASCADVLGRLIRNDLSLDLKVEDQNYRLVERSTGSTIRVISRHSLIRNAFSAYYDRLRTPSRTS